MTVCDPACGSGHFLLAAARRLGKEFARIETAEDEPTPEKFRDGVRKVIQHCIYGVDLNPLAVDLCKLALWIESHTAGKPLSFLDHRIRCGNSLIGILDPEVMAEGIPDDAYTAVTGDDKKIAAALKKQNKQERISRQRGFAFDAEDHSAEYAGARRQLDSIADDSPADVRRKAELYSSWRGGMQHSHDESVAHLWTAQFFLSLTEASRNEVCTTKDFLAFAVDKQKKPRPVAAAKAIAEQLRFFHWKLEFPEVFKSGGFDLVLGNPPWDRPEFHEKIYWAGDPYIDASSNESERERRIDEYRHASDEIKNRLARQYDIAAHAVAAGNKFWRECTRFTLTAVGKFNIFALFVEAALNAIAKRARAGMIVPTGIATDDVCKEFFAHIVKRKHLHSIVSLENRAGWFPDIDSRIQFSLLTLCDKASQLPQSWFYLLSPEEQHNPLRVLRLTEDDYELLNPNTLTSPLCRTYADLELTRKIYRTNPVLLRESPHENDYGIRIRRILNMGSSSVKLKAKTYDKLRSEEFELQEDGSFLADKEKWLPIFESKLIHQYQPRYATYEGVFGSPDKIKPHEITEPELSNSSFAVRARYWYAKSEIDANFREEWSRNWLLVFRDIARSTDERTVIASVIPYTATDLTLRVVSSNADAVRVALLLGCLNSLIFDYVCRQFLPSTHVSDYVTEQLAVVPIARYSSVDVEWIKQTVLELCYTTDSLRDFSIDMGFNAEPIAWNSTRRVALRAELDAYYAHLYGLHRDELRYILDPKDVFGNDFPSETFRVLKENEEKEFGKYRTRCLVLEAFDKLAETDRFRNEMTSRKSAFEVPTKKLLVAAT